MRVATRLATHTTIWQLVPLGDVQCWCGFLVGGRYRTRTCDPLLVRNKRGLEYMGFAGPTPVFMRFRVLVVDGCFVLLRSGWCPRGATGNRFA